MPQRIPRESLTRSYTLIQVPQMLQILLHLRYKTSQARTRQHSLTTDQPGEFHSFLDKKGAKEENRTSKARYLTSMLLQLLERSSVCSLELDYRAWFQNQAITLSIVLSRECVWQFSLRAVRFEQVCNHLHANAGGRVGGHILLQERMLHGSICVQ